MKFITIAGILGKSGIELIDEVARFNLGIVTGTGERAQKAIAKVNCYGKMAEVAANIEAKHVIVHGELCFNKDEDGTPAIFINRAMVSPTVLGCNINSVAVAGRLSKDPEVYTYGDKTKAIITIPINRSDDLTDWMIAEFWGKTAGVAESYLTKGKYAAIEGRLNIERYQNKDGADRTKFIIVGNKLTLCGGSAPQSDNDGERPVAAVAAQTTGTWEEVDF